MVFELTAVSAIVPSLLLIWYFHTRDVYPEPPRVIWATFGLGVLTVIPVLVVAMPLALAIRTIDDPFLGGFLEAWLTAGIPEEFFKFLVVVLYCSRHREFDEPMDGIVYGAIASLGFATFENVLYVSSGGTGAAIMRAFTAVPGHAFMGAIMGYYVGQARFTPARRGALLATGYLAAMTLHTLYDFPLLTLGRLTAGHAPVSDANGPVVALLGVMALAVLAFEWVWAVRLARRLRGAQQAGLASRARAMAMAPPLQPWAMSPPLYAQPSAPWTPPQPVLHAAQGYPLAPPMRPAAPASSSAAGWLLIAFGGLLASGGGLMLLGFGVLVAQARAFDQAPAVVAVSAVLFGLLPTALGGALFVVGVRRLNQRSAYTALR